MTVIILSDTAPETDLLHHTVSTDSLQTMRYSPSDFKKERMGFPDLPQGICLHMAEDQSRNDFPYSAKGVGTIRKNTHDSKDSTVATAVPVFTKHPAKGAKSKRLVVEKL